MVSKSNNKNRPTNVLLLKNPVGKSKPSTFDLPGEEHVYGKKVERKDEGAGEVLTHWNVVQKKQETEPGLDYIAMNRMAAKSHVLDAGAQATFRKTHPVRRKKINPQIKKEDLLPSDRDSAYTYGQPTRPSTPVARLMTDYYQEEWIRSQEKKRLEKESLEIERIKQQNQRALKSKNVMLKAHSHSTKQQRGKLGANANGERFILSKFKNADPKISSHRPANDLAITKYKVLSTN